MNKVLKYVVLAGILLALVLTSACSLRASKPPASQATATSELQFLATSTTVSDAVATQTAAVKPAVATATTEPKQVEQPTATVQESQSGGGQTQVQNQSQPIPTLSRPSTYALQKGEWPICIARRYDLNLSTFFSLNGLNMNSRPQVGAVLKIPSTGNWDSSAHGSRALRSHTDYKVQSGNSVYTIACYFGDVSPEGILAANGFSSANDVKAGNTIKIP